MNVGFSFLLLLISVSASRSPCGEPQEHPSSAQVRECGQFTELRFKTCSFLFYAATRQVEERVSKHSEGEKCTFECIERIKHLGKRSH